MMKICASLKIVFFVLLLFVFGGVFLFPRVTALLLLRIFRLGVGEKDKQTGFFFNVFLKLQSSLNHLQSHREVKMVESFIFTWRLEKSLEFLSVAFKCEFLQKKMLKKISYLNKTTTNVIITG